MGFGGFSAPGFVSGRMCEQGVLRTGWIAAFGTEGYDGEPPLLEELGINFGHISTKVRLGSNVLCNSNDVRYCKAYADLKYSRHSQYSTPWRE